MANRKTRSLRRARRVNAAKLQHNLRVNAENLRRYEAEVKASKTPGAAAPVFGSFEANGRSAAWAQHKADMAEIRKAAKNRKPITISKARPDTMADATEKYLMDVAWEAAEAGCDAGYEVLRDLLPAETPTPADVEPEAFPRERARITRLEKEARSWQYRWERIQARLWVAIEDLSAAEKRSRVAKGLATKSKKAYIADPTAEKYAKMLERGRNARVASYQLASRQQELAKVLEYEDRFVSEWVAADATIAALLEEANAKLEVAKLARRHTRMQEELEEAFSMRYERAEYVPEKEAPYRYKVYNVSANALYDTEVLHLVNEMKRLADEKPAGWKQQGKTLYASLAAKLRATTGAFEVDARQCVINNVTASMMSDIMGVVYGEKTPCKEMINVTYDIVGTFKIYYKFIDEDYEIAQKKLRNLRRFIVEHLIREGVTVTDGCETYNYKLLASSNSQQKKGQAYMGEAETMASTEKLREFGWSMEDAIASRTDNAAEWLKRNSTLMTPSRIIKNQDGRTVSLDRVLMMDDIEIDRLFDNVTVVTGEKLTNRQKKTLHLTMFDGQGIWLKKGFASAQVRGTAMKLMAVALPDYKLPAFTPDGRRIEDYDILVTKSCWKASKMGLSWDEFVRTVKELTKECPGYDLLRSVRYSDKEVEDEENPRNLARQASQQWVKITDKEVNGLTRKTRRWLNHNKKFATILAELGEWNKPETDRSPLARLFDKHPELLMHPYIQQWVKNNWTNKRDRACSGKLRIKGQYPYIVQDPIAMIQILLEGRDPTSTDLGVVGEGKVNLPKVKTGRKVYAIRYPANYLVGMILEQVNCPEFNDIGNVAVLSYYGDAITRADGDFDGDEMLFIFDKLVIELMEKTIKMFNPGLIDFSHEKLACDQPFGSVDNFVHEIAKALVAAQEFNLVGLYSNLAVICLQQASIAKNSLDVGRWMNAAIYAHVGAILCLDKVKGANVEETMDKKLAEQNRKIRKLFKMPWNQLFSHKELSEADVEKRSDSTQDRIAGAILDDVGEFAVDFDGMKPIECTDEVLLNLLATGVRTTSVRSMVVDSDTVNRILGCRFEAETDKATVAKLIAGEPVSLKDWLIFAWHNEAALTWKMKGVDMAEKKSELAWLVREACIANIRDSEWVAKEDGHVFTKNEKYASLVRKVVTGALGFDLSADGSIKEYGIGIDEEKRGSYAMFILRTFAEDILAMPDILDDETVNAMLKPREEAGVDLSFLGDIDPEELAAIMNDGSVWLGAEDAA